MNAIPALKPLDPEELQIGVVLPVHSETDSVVAVASDLRRILGGRLEEILVVLSPRSGEESRSVCEGLAASDPRIRIHVQEVNPGLGHAVREGLARVRGNVVLSMDSDGEMESATVGRMVREMERTGAACVLASRWLPGGGFCGYSGLKLPLNWLFQQLFRLLYATRLSDLTYGYKLMRVELARGFPWRGRLHEIACETSLRPIRSGFVVSEVPTRWTARTAGASKSTFLRNFRYVGTALAIFCTGGAFGPPRARKR